MLGWLKNDFVSNCEKWHAHAILDQTFSDVYDGQVWQYFNSVEGSLFLRLPHRYLLTMNVDWFEPFERGVYSVGATISLCKTYQGTNVTNLKTLYLLALYLAPMNINSFLTPLVLDLKEAWEKGFKLITSTNSTVNVKLVLSCVACDIPASRKVCGFLDSRRMQ